MKYYKVISKYNKSINSGKFDYTEYLPKGNKKGKWLPLIKDLKECSNGYHVTPYWNMWFNSEDNKVFEVEVKNLQEKKEVGVIDKYVCGSIRLVKKLKLTFDKNSNTGNSNTGDWNTGDCNTGDCNTGNSNTGDCNTGDRNTGYRNTGNSNTGDWNTGNSNTGDCNTGYWNTGNSNIGDRNTGYWNTGNSNIGDRNTGNWNKSNFNTGFFNTDEAKIIKVFNKDCDKILWDNSQKPCFLSFDIIDNDYKKSFKESFKKATKEDVKLLLELPNFDYKVFEEISGITKLMMNKKLK